MLQTEVEFSDPEAVSVNATGTKKPTSKVSTTSSSSKTTTMAKNNSGDAKNSLEKPSSTSASSSAANPFEWEEVKKARNRINSQRIRERERAQIANLEAERARLWLSNDAIRFQNRHFREIMAKILEVRDLKRSRAVANGGMGLGGAGVQSAQSTSNALAASLGATTGVLGTGSGMQMPLSMRHNTDMMGGLGGGLDAAGLFQSSRLSTAAKNLSGMSDVDLLARHQATTLEMQNMMRQQEAIDRLGAGGGVGLGGLNMGLNSGMNINGINMNGINMNGMNRSGMNMNAVAASPYADMADNLRIRQLMLQQSTASGVGDFEPRGLLSSMGGGGASNALGNNGCVGNGVGDVTTGNVNGNNFPFGAGALGDFGNGMGDADLLQMSKRQKFGF